MPGARLSVLRLLLGSAPGAGRDRAAGGERQNAGMELCGALLLKILHGNGLAAGWLVAGL